MRRTKYFFKIVFLTVIYILVTVVLKVLLDVDRLVYNSLSEQLTTIQIQRYLNLHDNYKWLEYIVYFVYTLLKTSIITSVLYIGIFFSKSVITFKSIFNKVIQAEFIFLLVPVFKIIWFYFFQTFYKLEDIQNFFPLSAINITGYEGLEPWYIYPLQTLNLFEVAYIFYLGFQIAKLTKSTPDEGLKMVVFSYVPALLLWVCIIMFLTLNYS